MKAQSRRVWPIVLGIAVLGLGLKFAWDGRGSADEGLFISRAGTTHDDRTGWTVVAAADHSRQTLQHGDLSTTPVWVARQGWFIYLENTTRAWAFNGDDLLILYVREQKGGAPTLSAYSSDTAPVPVPEPVIYRIGQQRVDAIANAARAARERLGLSPPPGADAP